MQNTLKRCVAVAFNFSIYLKPVLYMQQRLSYRLNKRLSFACYSLSHISYFFMNPFPCRLCKTVLFWSRPQKPSVSSKSNPFAMFFYIHGIAGYQINIFIQKANIKVVLLMLHHSHIVGLFMMSRLVNWGGNRLSLKRHFHTDSLVRFI